MAAAYVSHDTGASGRSVTVASGTTLLIAAVSRTADVGAGSTATYGGAAMSVASNSNGFAEMFYMLNPTVGSATLAVTGTNISTVVAAHYSGVTAFTSGTQGSVASFSLSPSGGALLAFVMSATTTSHTPLASNNERVDASGDYYCDRIETTGGTYSVGVASATDPDSAAGLFAAGATLTISTAAFAAGDAAMATTATVGRTVTTAAFAADAAAMATTATVSGNRSLTAADFAADAATMAATVIFTRAISAADFAAGSATMAASAIFTRAISAADFAAGAATMAATLSIPLTIVRAGATVSSSSPNAIALASRASGGVTVSSPTVRVTEN